MRAAILAADRAPNQFLGLPVRLVLLIAALVIVLGGLWVYARRAGLSPSRRLRS